MRTAAGHEVDFLARYPEGGTELIQVCADLSAAPTREREFRGLLEAAAEHPEASLHLIALDPEDDASIVPAVNVHSAVSWLLGSAS